jgi:hypothetical protein
MAHGPLRQYARYGALLEDKMTKRKIDPDDAQGSSPLSLFEPRSTARGQSGGGEPERKARPPWEPDNELLEGREAGGSRWDFARLYVRDRLHPRTSRRVVVTVATVFAIGVVVVGVAAIGNSRHAVRVKSAAASGLSASSGYYGPSGNVVSSQSVRLVPGTVASSTKPPRGVPGLAPVGAPPPPMRSAVPIPTAGRTPSDQAPKGAGPPSVSGSPARTTASAPATSSPVEAPPQTVEITGQANCTSGHPIEGFWVEGAGGSGWASWEYASETNADYWFALPEGPPYKISIGCGGTRESWQVATYSGSVSGTHNSFNCYDVSGQANYGQCLSR